MKHLSAIKFSLFALGTLLAAVSQAGTYSIVSGPDTSLLTASAGSSFSTSSLSLILTSSTGASANPGHQSGGGGTSIQGEVHWRVRWTEGYPGEPAPTSRQATVDVTPTTGSKVLNSLVTATATNAGTTATSHVAYTSTDTFLSGFSDTATAVGPTPPIVRPDSKSGGTTTWDTTTFTLVSSGVYEADIIYFVNTNLFASASISGTLAAAANATLSIGMKYTITAVDGQPI